jgi:hypothetical protein
MMMQTLRNIFERSHTEHQWGCSKGQNPKPYSWIIAKSLKNEV